LRSKYKRLELERGKPMRDILTEEFLMHGNQADVAASLGVSQPTISQWLTRLQLKQVATLVQEKSA